VEVIDLENEIDERGEEVCPKDGVNLSKMNDL